MSQAAHGEDSGSKNNGQKVSGGFWLSDASRGRLENNDARDTLEKWEKWEKEGRRSGGEVMDAIVKVNLNGEGMIEEVKGVAFSCRRRGGGS